jgi:hypothetical protein
MQTPRHWLGMWGKAPILQNFENDVALKPGFCGSSSSYISLPSFEKYTSDLSSHGHCHSRRRHYWHGNRLLSV